MDAEITEPVPAAPLGTPADAVAIERAALKDYPNNVVDKLLHHRMDVDGMKVKVRWLGFDVAHDTYEPLTNLAEDVSEQVEDFLRVNARFDRAYFGPLRRGLAPPPPSA